MQSILDEKQWEKELDDQDSKIVPDEASASPKKAKSLAQPEQEPAPVAPTSAPLDNRTSDASDKPSEGETSAWADSPYNQENATLS